MKTANANETCERCGYEVNNEPTSAAKKKVVVYSGHGGPDFQRHVLCQACWIGPPDEPEPTGETA